MTQTFQFPDLMAGFNVMSVLSIILVGAGSWVLEPLFGVLAPFLFFVLVAFAVGKELRHGCCSPSSASVVENRPLGTSQRLLRGAFASVALAISFVLFNVSSGWTPVVTAFVASWFCLSFWVAAITGYPGCPEIGAVPQLFCSHPIVTRCSPLDRVDQLLGLSSASSSSGTENKPQPASS
jgi:MFS family permease